MPTPEERMAWKHQPQQASRRWLNWQSWLYGIAIVAFCALVSAWG